MWLSHREWASRSAACALLAAACALGGCVAKSVAPVVGDDDREFDARLAGNWEGDNKESAVVTARGQEYLIVFTDDDVSTRLVGRLGRLGSYRVLDVIPDGSDMKVSDAYSGLMLPLHTFFIIDSIGGVLRARAVQPDSLKAYLQREPAAIAHTEVEGNAVLTATTPELRAFLERFVARPGVLSSGTWTRR